MNRAEYLLDRPMGALLFDELEDYHEAIDGFSACIRENRCVGVAYHNRAQAYWEIGRLEEALHDFSAAALALPDDPMPLQRMGMLLDSTGRLDEAIQSLDRAVAIAPDESTVRRTRAHMLVKAKKLGLALEDFDHAIVLEPDFKRTKEDRDKVAAQLARENPGTPER